MKVNTSVFLFLLFTSISFAQTVNVNARFTRLANKEYNADDVIGDDDLRFKHSINGTWSGCSEKNYSSFCRCSTHAFVVYFPTTNEHILNPIICYITGSKSSCLLVQKKPTNEDRQKSSYICL